MQGPRARGLDERREDECAVGGTEQRIDGVFGMRHQSHDVAALVHDSCDVGSRTVDGLRVAEDDLAPCFELLVEVVVCVPGALSVLDRDQQLLAFGAASRERRVGEIGRASCRERVYACV